MSGFFMNFTLFARKLVFIIELSHYLMYTGTSQVNTYELYFFTRKLVFIIELLHHLMYTGISQVNTYELNFVHLETCVYY